MLAWDLTGIRPVGFEPDAATTKRTRECNFYIFAGRRGLGGACYCVMTVIYLSI